MFGGFFGLFSKIGIKINWRKFKEVNSYLFEIRFFFWVGCYIFGYKNIWICWMWLEIYFLRKLLIYLIKENIIYSKC